MTNLPCNDYADLEQMAIDIAQKLIKFENPNPPGNDKEITVYISELLEGFGFDVEIHRVNDRVYALRACLGNKDHIGLIFSGHLDVVPVSRDWTHAPFNPVIHEGKMYGRGAADMKSGLAAMIAAASHIAQNYNLKERGLALVFNGDEEISNLGMIDINKLGWLKGDAAVIGEPTQCQIHLGNRGASIHHIITRGVACHASNPCNGANAIYKMAEAILKLKDYADYIRKNITDPYLGSATLSVGVIHGGQEANIVPDYCMAAVERRLLWKEDAAEVSRQIQEAIGGLGEVSLYFSCPASLIYADHPLIKTLSQSIQTAAGEEPVVGVFPASTEGAFLSLYNNIPTVIFGPGSIKQAHTADEWIDMEDIRKATRIYIELAKKWLDL